MILLKKRGFLKKIKFLRWLFFVEIIISFVGVINFSEPVFSGSGLKGIWTGPKMNFPGNKFKVLNSNCFRLTFADPISLNDARYAASYLDRELKNSETDCFLKGNNRLDIHLIGHDNFIYRDPFERASKGYADLYNYSAPYDSLLFPPERKISRIAGYQYFKKRIHNNIPPLMRLLSKVLVPMWLIRGTTCLFASSGNWHFDYSLAHPEYGDRNINYLDLAVKDRGIGINRYNLIMESARFVKHLIDLKGKKVFIDFILQLSHTPYDIDTIFEKNYNNGMKDCFDNWKKAFYSSLMDQGKNLKKISKDFEIMDFYNGPVYSPLFIEGQKVVFTTEESDTNHYQLMLKDKKGSHKLIDKVGKKIDICSHEKSHIIYITKINEASNGTVYEDLFKYVLQSGRLIRVTSKKYLTEPSVSGTGKRVVAVEKGIFTSSIVEIDSGGCLKYLTRPKSGKYDFSPDISEKGDKTVFVRYAENLETGMVYGNLMLLDKNNEIYKITDDCTARFQPVWMDEKRIIFLEQNISELMIIELFLDLEKRSRSLKNLVTCDNYIVNGLNCFKSNNKESLICTIKEPWGYRLGTFKKRD